MHIYAYYVELGNFHLPLIQAGMVSTTVKEAKSPKKNMNRDVTFVLKY